MKRIILLVFISALTLSLTGCSANSSINQTKAGREQAAEILRCLDADDTEGLKNMFCEKVASSHDLDEEIVEAMEFYSGKSVSFSSILVGGGDSMKDGELTDSHIEYSIKNIQTETGGQYKIATGSYLVYDSNPSYEGIIYLKIIDENTDTRIEIGGI